MQQTEWSPPALGIAACGIFGLILAIGAVTLITDAPGRILVGIAAAGLLVFASLSWLARKVRLLEIDTTDGRLLVYTRWDLGTDPLNVLDALTAAGYAGSG